MAREEASNTKNLSQGSLGFLAPALPARVTDNVITFLDEERDQWIIWCAVALGAGVVFYFSLDYEPSLVTALFATVAIAGAMFALPRHTLITVALGLALTCATGFTLAKLKTEWIRAPVLKTSGLTFDITGTIEQVEPRSKSSIRLTLNPDRIGNIRKRWRPTRIRVTVSSKLAGATGMLNAGDRVSFRARLNPPPGPALPGGHDFARYAWFQGLGAVGFAVSNPLRIADADVTRTVTDLSTFTRTARRAIGQRINRVLPTETGAIANALITGQRGAISDATNDAYRAAGLYHILSISGLHMAIMGGAVFFLLRTLLAMIPHIALTQPIKKWAAVGAIAGALAYLLISGGAFATVRSFIMIVIMFLAILVDRPAIALRNVALAAIVILVLFPESVLDPGFQMSFAAVTALIVGFEGLRLWRPETDGSTSNPLWLRGIIWPLAAIVLSTILASAAVTPFAIYHFNNAQHYAVLANLVAMPVCNLIVMPAALATLIALPFGLEFIPLYAMGFGIDIMTHTSNWVAHLPGAVSTPPALATHVFALIVAGGLILLIIRQTFRLIGLAAIATGVALAPGINLPDILISRDANLIAVATPRSTLEAVKLDKIPIGGKSSGAKKAPYELQRWMEHFGDARPPEAAMKTNAFQCDRVSCTVRKNGVLLALPFHPSAQREDCKRAQILVTNQKITKTCVGPKVIIDRSAVQSLGTHAIYISKQGAIDITTANQSRGNRPWVRK